VRINPVKFQPSRSKGAGGDRGDGQTRMSPHFPMSYNDFSTSSLAIKKISNKIFSCKSKTYDYFYEKKTKLAVFGKKKT